MNHHCCKYWLIRRICPCPNAQQHAAKTLITWSRCVGSTSDEEPIASMKPKQKKKTKTITKSATINNLPPNKAIAGMSTASTNNKIGGPVLKSVKKKFAPNAIFRVVSCLYILYDLTCSIWLKNSTNSHSYKAYHCFTVFLTSDWLVTHSSPLMIKQQWCQIPLQSVALCQTWSVLTSNL